MAIYKTWTVDEAIKLIKRFTKIYNSIEMIKTKDEAFKAAREAGCEDYFDYNDTLDDSINKIESYIDACLCDIDNEYPGLECCIYEKLI